MWLAKGKATNTRWIKRTHIHTYNHNNIYCSFLAHPRPPYSESHFYKHTHTHVCVCLSVLCSIFYCEYHVTWHFYCTKLFFSLITRIFLFENTINQKWCVRRHADSNALWAFKRLAFLFLTTLHASHDQVYQWLINSQTQFRFMHLHVHRHHHRHHQCPLMSTVAHRYRCRRIGCTRRLPRYNYWHCRFCYMHSTSHSTSLLQHHVSARFLAHFRYILAVRSTLKYFRSCGSPSLRTRLIRIMLFAIVPLSHRRACQH